VGYFLSNMKSIADAHIGDTFYEEKTSKSLVEPFPGYQNQKPMVFAGIYPEDPDDYEELEKSLRKLCLTDGSVSFSYEQSAALGSGFRCGFLGMLHMDVFRQRLEDEHDLNSLITAPTVSYKCKLINSKDLLTVENPLEAPRDELVAHWEEILMVATIMTPVEFAADLKKLCEHKRGIAMTQEYINDGKNVHLQYQIPLSELISDFFDQLKSLSSGYASLDYEHFGY